MSVEHLGIQEMFGTAEVKGAATLASASDRDTPTWAAWRATVLYRTIIKIEKEIIKKSFFGAFIDAYLLSFSPYRAITKIILEYTKARKLFFFFSSIKVDRALAD